MAKPDENIDTIDSGYQVDASIFVFGSLFKTPYFGPASSPAQALRGSDGRKSSGDLCRT